MANLFKLLQQFSDGNEEAAGIIVDFDPGLATSLWISTEKELEYFLDALSAAKTLTHVSTGRTFDIQANTYTVKANQSVIVPVMGEEFESLEIPLEELPQWSAFLSGTHVRKYIYELKGKQYRVPLHYIHEDMAVRFELEPWSGGHNRLLVVEPPEEFISLSPHSEHPRMAFRLVCMYTGRALKVRSEVPGYLSQKEMEALLLQHKILECGELTPCA